MPLGTPNKVVQATYDAWVRHRELCVQCGIEDLMEPGAPLLVPLEDEVPITAQDVVESSGEVYSVHNVADIRVLCEDGARLFKEWRRATIIFPR